MFAHFDNLHGIGAARLADGLTDGQHDQIADLHGASRNQRFLRVEQHLTGHDRAELYWWTAYIVSENYSSSISGRCASLPQNAIKVSIPNPLLEPSVGHLCPVSITTARGSAKTYRATEGVAFLRILHFALKLSKLAT